MAALKVFIMIISPVLFWQDKETPLDKKNGFQDIQLTSDAKSYQGLELKKNVKDHKIPDAAVYQAKSGYYENVGNVKIHELKVMTHKDRIYEIVVILEKDPNLYKSLERRFGKGNYSMPIDAYVWNGEKVTLRYEQHSKKKIRLTYTSIPMRRVIWESKEDKVDELADDF